MLNWAVLSSQTQTKKNPESLILIALLWLTGQESKINECATLEGPIPNWHSYCVDITVKTTQGRVSKEQKRLGCLLHTSKKTSITNNTEQWSFIRTSDYNKASCTIGEGADSSRRDSSVDTPEAPCLVEALLTLQSCLNGVQREEGQIHTHPRTASSLQRQRWL